MSDPNRILPIDGLVINQYLSPWANIYNADCIKGMMALLRSLPDGCVDFSCFSPPFESLFVYSASDHDLGNSHGGAEFSLHLSFLAEQMFRIMKPGTIVCIHCMDLPTTLTHHGYIGFIDFPARLREVYEKAGFIYHCPKITIWKDPEVAANRTYARQLTHGEMVKDSSMSGVGAPDYIVVMRKPGRREAPISHDGDALATKDDSGKPRHWQRWASPVWGWPTDQAEMMLRRLANAINAGDPKTAAEAASSLACRSPDLPIPTVPEFVWATANGLWTDGFVDYESPRAGNPDKRGIDQGDTLNFRAARENDDERHICPLQVGVVRRLIDLYTKPGEVVLTPFMGIGTEVATAVEMGRRGVGFELKRSYFRQSVEHVKRVEPGAKGQQLSILDAAPSAIAMGRCEACEAEGPIGECGICGAEVKP